jgi:hypothetical protein
MSSSNYADMPAGKPPPGVIPNFDDPESRAIVMHIGISICLGVALVFVLLRIYVKLAVTRAWGWDDGELLYEVSFLEAHCNRVLPFGICETCRSCGFLDCSDGRWYRARSQPTLVQACGVSFGFCSLRNLISGCD